MKNPYLRLVPNCVFLQYVYEAKQRNKSVNQYIAWLKRQAGIRTAYDVINEKWREEQKQAESRQQRIWQEVKENEY